VLRRTAMSQRSTDRPARPGTGATRGAYPGLSAHVPESVSVLAGSEKNDGDPKGARTVGTSLTPEFWERFSVLLIAAIGLTCVLTASFDALAVRLLRRRVRTQSQQTGAASTVAEHRASVHT
jgi:hypothetical protein